MKTLGKLSQIAILSIATAFVVGCGGGDSSSNTDTNTTTETETIITHNGVDYKTVTSPTTGRVWLDRNLGAAEVCQTFNDTACYGDYYQWGRNTDGHQDSTSSTTVTQASNVNNVGNSFFIKGYKDWLKSGVDDNGAKRAVNWSKTDGSSVCPKGFRVPTLAELDAEGTGANIKNREDAFNSFLKLPAAGGRDIHGNMMYSGETGVFWSTTLANIQEAYIVIVAETKVINSIGDFIIGASIRCIKAQ